MTADTTKFPYEMFTVPSGGWRFRCSALNLVGFAASAELAEDQLIQAAFGAMISRCALGDGETAASD